VITFTPVIDKKGSRGRSTIGGEEGTNYTATVVITDSLSNMTTEPVTGTAVGTITHLANLIPTKSAPAVIGPNQYLTYTINVWNSGLSTDTPPPPYLIDTVPMSTTFVSASDDYVTRTLTGTTIVSWTLPAMSTGSTLTRSFTVLVDPNLVSGTQIVNYDYRAYWYENDPPTYTGYFSNTGQVVTTTVQEIGLIDSYKEVTPAAVLPGGVLTYYVHIVNSSGLSLTDVTVEDLLPWQDSTYGEFGTYQRDAVASGGDIVEEDSTSIHWEGAVDGFSSQVITFSIVVDPDYTGPLTNTAIISHPDLLNEIERQVVAYVTDKPVLHISKVAAPSEVDIGGEILYTIRVDALGWPATGLVITDTIPSNTEYITDSATANGQLVGDQVQWEIAGLAAGESRTFEFRVTVNSGSRVINDHYMVTSIEGSIGVGASVQTNIKGTGASGGPVYLPIILKNH
jgi:uncharacterized repeat protein (TIGR01451 family)